MQDVRDMVKKNVKRSLVFLILLSLLCTTSAVQTNFFSTSTKKGFTSPTPQSSDVLKNKVFAVRETPDFYDVMIDNVSLAGVIDFTGYGYVLIQDSEFVEDSDLNVYGNVIVFVQNVNFSTATYNFKVWDNAQLIVTNAETDGYSNFSITVSGNGIVELKDTNFGIQQITASGDSAVTLENHNQTYATNFTGSFSGHSKLNLTGFISLGSSFILYLYSSAEATITDSILSTSGVVSLTAYDYSKISLKNVDFGNYVNSRNLTLQQSSTAYIYNASYIDHIWLQMVYGTTVGFIAEANVTMINSTVGTFYSESCRKSYIYNSTIDTIQSSTILEGKTVTIKSDTYSSDWTNSVIADAATTYTTWTMLQKYFVKSSTVDIENSTVSELYSDDSTFNVYNSTIQKSYIKNSVFSFNASKFYDTYSISYVLNSTFIFDNSSTTDAYMLNFRFSNVVFKNLNTTPNSATQYYFYESNFTVRDCNIQDTTEQSIFFYDTDTQVNYLVFENVTWPKFNLETHGGSASLYNTYIAIGGSVDVYGGTLNGENTTFRYFDINNLPSNVTLTNVTITERLLLMSDSNVTIRDSSIKTLFISIDDDIYTTPVTLINTNVTDKLINGLALRSGALRINGSQLVNMSTPDPDYCVFAMYDANSIINNELFYIVYVSNATLYLNNIAWVNLPVLNSSHLESTNSSIGTFNSTSSTILSNDTMFSNFYAFNSSASLNNVTISSDVSITYCNFTAENNTKITGFFSATNSNVTLNNVTMGTMSASESKVDGEFITATSVTVNDELLPSARTVEFRFVNSTINSFEAATEEDTVIINSTIGTMLFYYRNATVINSTITTLYQFAIYNNSGTLYNDIATGISWNVTTLINSQAAATVFAGIIVLHGTVNVENSTVMLLATANDGKIIANNISQIGMIQGVDSGYIRLDSTTINSDFETISLYNNSVLELHNVTIHFANTSDAQNFIIYDSGNLTAIQLSLEFIGSLSTVYTLMEFANTSTGHFDNLTVNYNDPDMILTFKASGGANIYVTHSNHTSVMAEDGAVIKLIDSDCNGYVYLRDDTTFVLNNTEGGHSVDAVASGVNIDSFGNLYLDQQGHAMLYVYNGFVGSVLISYDSTARVRNSTIINLLLLKSVILDAKNVTADKIGIIDESSDLVNEQLKAGILDVYAEMRIDNTTVNTLSMPYYFVGKGVIEVNSTTVAYSGVTYEQQGYITDTSIKMVQLYSLYMNGTINCTIHDFINNASYVQILGGAFFNTTHDTGAPKIETSTDYYEYEENSFDVATPTFTIYDLMPYQYKLYRNDTLIEQDTFSNGIPISLNLIGLSAGVYNFTIEASDAFYQTSVATIMVKIYPRQAPIFVNKPDSLYYVRSNTDALFQWTCTDMFPHNYTIYLNDTLVKSGDWTDNVPVNYTFNSDLSSGTFILNATFFDKGNSGTTQLITIVLDNTAPSLSVTPEAWEQEEGGPYTLLTFTILDNNNGTYTIYEGDTVVVSGIYVPSTFTVKVNTSNFDGMGVHKISLVANGGIGNERTLNTTVITYHNEGPEIISSLEHEYTIKVNEQLPLNWTAKDKFPGTYEIAVRGIIVKQGTWDNNTLLSYVFQANESGDYEVQLRVYDLAKNPSAFIMMIHVEGGGGEEPFPQLDITLLAIIAVIAVAVVVVVVVMHKKRKSSK